MLISLLGALVLTAIGLLHIRTARAAMRDTEMERREQIRAEGTVLDLQESVKEASRYELLGKTDDLITVYGIMVPAWLILSSETAVKLYELILFGRLS